MQIVSMASSYNNLKKAAVLSKFADLSRSSYFVVYSLKLKSILIYNVP